MFRPECREESHLVSIFRKLFARKSDVPGDAGALQALLKELDTSTDISLEKHRKILREKRKQRVRQQTAHRGDPFFRALEFLAVNPTAGVVFPGDKEVIFRRQFILDSTSLMNGESENIFEEFATFSRKRKFPVGSIC